MTCVCDSFRVLRKVVEILVTPAITRNIRQFNCAEHGQEITFKESCGMQGILVPFLLFFQHKDACLGSSPFLNATPQEAPLFFPLPSSELKESHTQLQKLSVVHFWSYWNFDTAITVSCPEYEPDRKYKGKKISILCTSERMQTQRL